MATEDVRGAKKSDRIASSGQIPNKSSHQQNKTRSNDDASHQKSMPHKSDSKNSLRKEPDRPVKSQQNSSQRVTQNGDAGITPKNNVSRRNENGQKKLPKAQTSQTSVENHYVSDAGDSISAGRNAETSRQDSKQQGSSRIGQRRQQYRDSHHKEEDDVETKRDDACDRLAQDSLGVGETVEVSC